jgi:hypothetical protein
MRKVSMNEQQFERFITENAIRVAQRYLMESADMGADEEGLEDDFYADDLEEGADSEDFDEERFDIYVNGECRYRDVDSSLAHSILGQFGPNDDVEVKRAGEDDFED